MLHLHIGAHGNHEPSPQMVRGSGIHADKLRRTRLEAPKRSVNPQEDSSPTKALNKEDFPALGFPQIAT